MTAPTRRTLTGWIAGMLVAACLPLLAQGQGATERVDWSVSVSPEVVQAGDTARVHLRASIDDGWKMYALDSPAGRPVSVQFDKLPAGIQPGTVRQEEPSVGFDPNFQDTVTYFADRAHLWADLSLSEAVEAGRHALKGSVTFMVCTDKLCLPPTPQPFTATLTVEGAAASTGNVSERSQDDASSASADTSVEAAPDFTVEANPLSAHGDSVAGAAGTGSALRAPGRDGVQGGGLWPFLLLAAGAGLAALLTPCVFPMIPLTVSYFTKHAGSRSESFRLALVYGGAIVTTFTGLGLLTALLVGAAGAQTIAANPWVNLFIGGVFVFFALSLLGLFELRLPSSLLNYFNRQSGERVGYGGVLFMGLTLTLVSFSCTAPFIGGLLAATAQGAWSYPVAGMLVFSVVFSLPFVAFALFPHGLGKLPQSGSWMRSVKVTLGFVELAAALKFLSNADLIWGWGLISRTLAIALTVVIFFMAGLYLIGKLPLGHVPARTEIGVGRLLFAIAFFGTALYMMPGLLGAPLGRVDAYLPPRQSGDVSLLRTRLEQAGSKSVRQVKWYEDVGAAFRRARQVGKPVFIDFTGYTCTNCREMEANVFPQPEVARRFAQDFVLLRLYTDARDRGPALQKYQLRLTGTVALPTYAIVRPGGRMDLVTHISGMRSVEAFAAFLDRGLASFENGNQLAAR